MKTLEIRRPDDLHLHFRDGDALATPCPRLRTYSVVPSSCQTSYRRLPRSHGDQYRDRILKVVPEGKEFEPLMVLYFRDDTSAEELIAAAKSEFVHGVKLYPAGATTNSKSGVTDISSLSTDGSHGGHGLPLLIHGEVTDPSVDVFDREKLFIETHLEKIVRRASQNSSIVFEHITSQAAAEFVAAAPDNVARHDYTAAPHA